jgi:hypothetical protein
MEFLVDASPEAVFAVAADIAGWARSVSAIESVEMLPPGPVGVGTRFRETRTMFGRRASEEMTVAELVPPQRLVLTAFNHGTAYRAEHRFAPDLAGTRMTLVFEGRPTALLARLFAPLGRLFAGAVRRQLETDGADLKREAERRHRGGQALRV